MKTFVRSGKPEWDGLEFHLDDPRIPDSIRTGLRPFAEQGYAIFFADTVQGGEWWVLDGENLVEGFWLIG